MYTVKIASVFYLIGIVYFVKSEAPNILLEKSVTEEQAAKSLRKILPEETLPLILFKDSKNTLLLPHKLEKVVEVNERISHGTEFTSKKPSEQLFFCPKDKQCLVQQIYEENQPLECTSEVNPIVIPNSKQCGDRGLGIVHIPIYEICDSEKNSFVNRYIEFYSICYDLTNEKSLFATHTIQSAALLNSKLLFREREVNFNMRNDLVPVEVEKTPSTRRNVKKPGYKRQKLVPPEDMALALWRKITFQKINTDLQHEKLIDLWNEICTHVRNNAIQMFSTEKLQTTIFTGVFDIDPTPKDIKDNQTILNIWIKLVYIVKPNGTLSTPTHGVAILMNNFIDNEIDDPASLNKKENSIENHCIEDLCIDALKNKFNSVQGQIRCCPVTPKIFKFFDEDQKLKVEELRIRNVTILEDQETLEDSSATEDQIRLIGKIEPNQILPMILFLNPDNSALEVPTNVVKIEVANKRIVNGSKFYIANSTEQIFFCPKEAINENCLEPRKFKRFEPLQCTKLAIPVAREVSSSQNKCGINASGVYYDIIYEICLKQKPYQYKTKEIKFYQFCYDPKAQKILFARHRIRSLRVLFSKFMYQEHAVEYPIMMKNVDVRLSNYQELKVVATLMVPDENKEPITPTNKKKYVYKLQKLVPPEDIPFALWRKTAYEYINFELQHETLIPLWNEINRFVRDDIINSYISKKYTNDISAYTGVFGVESTLIHNPDNQKLNIWVKIIYTKETTIQEGLAILMNNFLISEEDQFPSSDLKAKALENYCDENLCLLELQTRFEAVGSRIRCCPLTTEVVKLFGITDVGKNPKLIKIRYVTHD